MTTTQIKNLFKLNKSIILLFILTNISLTAKAQDGPDYLDYYTFFGLHTSLNYYVMSEVEVNETVMDVQYNKLASGTFGVVFQMPKPIIIKTNRNPVGAYVVFQTGFNVRHIHQNLDLEIDSSQSGSSGDIKVHTDLTYNVFNIPITANIFITDKLFGHSSIVFGFYKDLNTTSTTTEGSISVTTNMSNPKILPFNLNTEVGLGYNITTPRILWQPYLYASLGFNSIAKGSIQIQGIGSYDTGGSVDQTNMFVGFGLNMYPKRFW